ncbi:MAG TPA: ATP-binding protein [Thermoanaerobaculia bacterium]|nr:ATP-binding protein [Thermoanaerobaculia bacterium]
MNEPPATGGAEALVLERQAWEQALRDSQRQLRLALDAARMGTWVWDIRTGEIHWSDNLEPLHGLDPGTFGGTYEDFLRLVHPDDRDLLRATVALSVETLTPYELEFRVLWPDGSVHWMDGRGQVFLDELGNPASMLGLGIDVTERKRNEEESRAAREAAEAANRAKDRFLAVLSHELRTPLTPVLTALSALERHPAVPAELRPSLEMIQRNVALEARLIDDLLDLTRIANGKLQLGFATVDVHALIGQALQICGADAEAKRLSLDTDLAAGQSHVHGDSARLHQVLWNLIKNAVKFTPEGGRIAVRTFNPEPDRLRIEVADSGIGIAADVLPRIFDAFEQGRPEINRHFGGLGLGLAISQGLVEAHHGTLTASSDGPGRGASFHVDLSALPEGAAEAEKEGAEAPAASSPDPTARIRRILLVDDHLDTLEIMALLLRNSSFEVHEAGDVRSALAIAASLAADAGDTGGEPPFDLVVSDLGLPDGSGLDLMQELRDRYGLQGIALSGYGMQEDVRKSREAGFVEHLVKPVTFQTLQAAIERVLG